MTVLSLSMSDEYYRSIIKAFPDVSAEYYHRNAKILVILALAKNARESGLIEDLYVMNHPDQDRSRSTHESDMIVEGCLEL